MIDFGPTVDPRRRKAQCERLTHVVPDDIELALALWPAAQENKGTCRIARQDTEGYLPKHVSQQSNRPELA